MRRHPLEWGSVVALPSPTSQFRRDAPVEQQMYLKALKWAMGLVPGDATPRPGSRTR